MKPGKIPGCFIGQAKYRYLLGIELWHTTKKFSDNCILSVLASDVYNESDYIRCNEVWR